MKYPNSKCTFGVSPVIRKSIIGFVKNPRLPFPEIICSSCCVSGSSPNGVFWFYNDAMRSFFFFLLYPVNKFSSEQTVTCGAVALLHRGRFLWQPRFNDTYRAIRCLRRDGKPFTGSLRVGPPERRLPKFYTSHRKKILITVFASREF